MSSSMRFKVVTNLSGDDLGSRDVTDIRQSNEISKGGHPVRTFNIFVRFFHMLGLNMPNYTPDDAFFLLLKWKNEVAWTEVSPLALAYAVARGVRSWSMSFTIHTLASSSLKGTPTAAPERWKCVSNVCLKKSKPFPETLQERHELNLHLKSKFSCIPAGLTCLNEVAAGNPRAFFNSLTSCQAFRASHRLMKPGDPFSTETKSEM